MTKYGTMKGTMKNELFLFFVFLSSMSLPLHRVTSGWTWVMKLKGAGVGNGNGGHIGGKQTKTISTDAWATHISLQNDRKMSLLSWNTHHSHKAYLLFNGNINKHTIFKLDQTDHCYGNILPDKCLSSKSHFFCHLTVAYVWFCSFIKRITPKICM